MRISFAGGGTDLPAYYERFGGEVISATLDKYFYVFMNPTGGNIQITSSDFRTFYRHRARDEMLWEGDLAIPKAVLHHFGITEGISLFMASEIPPGTGLGSSSSVAVAVIKALSTLCGISLSPARVAELACDIEIGKLGMPIGKQDQYAAAYGGINRISFSRKGVSVEPLQLTPELIHRLERRIMLFFTGASRKSSSILERQRNSSARPEGATVEALHALKAMASEVREVLEREDLETFGRLLHEAWEQKKRLASGITTGHIDDCYQAALTAGATGGKVAGAGGGGFLMLYCEPRHQDRVTAALEDRGLARIDFHFEFGGAMVLLNAARMVQSMRVPVGI